MKYVFWLLWVCAFVPFTSAQESPFDIPVAPRVDTTDADVRAVYELWRSYLSSRPDSVYDNPHWSEGEKAQRYDFDLSRKWTYGYDLMGVSGRANLHDIYDIQPYVLSIEQAGNGYSIRTLYVPSNTDTGMFTVQRVYARKERGEWRLFSALPVATKDWVRYRVGPVEYVVEPDHTFDKQKARATAAYVDSLRLTFGLEDEPPITFYLASTTEAMARAIGLEYTWDPNDGRAYPRDRLLLRGDGSEWNPHEVAHAVFGRYDLTYIVLEGLATYLGGSGDRSFRMIAEDLAHELSEDDTVKFDDVIRGKAASVTMFYGTGAILGDAVLEEEGVEGLRRFLTLSSTPQGVYEGLDDVLGVSKEEADEFWRTRAQSYIMR